MRTLNLTVDGNDKLSLLQRRAYAEQITAVPNKAFSGQLADDLNAVYNALTSNDLDPEGNTFAVKATSTGAFDRLYGPSVYSKDETSIVIRWGSEFIPLVFVEAPSRGKKKTYELAPEKSGVDPADLVLTFINQPFGNSGKFDPMLRLTVTTEENDTISVDFPVWSKDNKDKPSADLLNNTVRTSPKTLGDLIAEPSANFEGPTLNFRVEMEDENGTHLGEYTVIGYRGRKTKYGMNYVMLIDSSADDAYSFDAFEAWAPNDSVKGVLATSPVISPESPAKLFISNRKRGVSANGAWCRVEGSIVIDEKANTVADEQIDLDF